jgi:hypothetical protein
MKSGSLALILVCASMSLVAQIDSPSILRANDGGTTAIVLTGDLGTGEATSLRTVRLSATTFTALIIDWFSRVKELVRELLLRCCDHSATASANTNVISLQRFRNILMAPCRHEISGLHFDRGGFRVALGRVHTPDATGADWDER